MPVDRTGAERENNRLRDAIEFVRLGYGDNFGLDFRSLYFRTQELTTDEAQAVMRIIEEYNEFDGRQVADTIEQFRGKIAAYEFGREGSPVLYVRLPHWTHHREGEPRGKMGRRIDDAEIDTLIAAFKEILVQRLGAEEFGMDEIEKRKIRAWWD